MPLSTAEPGCRIQNQSIVIKRSPPSEARLATVGSTLIYVRVAVTEIGC